MQGTMHPDTYLQLVLSYGLSGELPSLMMLCPAPQRRAALLGVYHATFVAGTTGIDGVGYVPPEAAAAACAQVAARAPWQCVCGVVNSPDDGRCDQCSRPQPAVETMEVDGLTGGGYGAGGDGIRVGGKSGGGGRLQVKSSTSTTQAGGVVDFPALLPSTTKGKTKGAASKGVGLRTKGGVGSSSTLGSMGSAEEIPGGSEGSGDLGTSMDTTSTAAAAAGAAAGAAGGKKKKNKAVRVPLQDFLDPRQHHTVNPRNVWTQNHPLKSNGNVGGASGAAGASGTSGSGNEWAKAGGGRLAQELRAVSLATSGRKG